MRRGQRIRAALASGATTIFAIVACAAVLPCARPLGAQQPQAARDTLEGDTLVARLPAIQVIGSILRSAGPAVGSGVPARVAQMGAARIERWRPRTLADALATEPGMSLYDDLGSPFKTTLVARGFTASPVVGLPQGISVFVDGVPVNEPDAGQVNFDLLPLAHVERVEVLSGTASLLGPHSLGGAVNLVTKRGARGTTGEIEIAGGSFGALALSGAVSGAARGWSWYAGAGRDAEDGWRDRTGARRAELFVNVGRGRADASMNVQLFAGRSRAETAGSLPESMYDVRPGTNFSAGDFEDLRQLHLAVAGYREVVGGRASFNVYARAHDAERFNVNQAADPDVRAFSANRTLGAGADWTASRPIARGEGALRVGAVATLNDVEIELHAERIDPGLTTDVSSPIRSAGAYAMADWTLGRLTLSGGARLDVVRIPFRNALNPARDTTSTFAHLSPSGGVRVRLWRGASLYASVGRGFRAPAVIELACADPEQPCPLPFALGDDPPLDPVVATTYETGGRWLLGRLLLGAAAYHTDVSDEIFLFPYDDASEPEASTLDGYFDNVPRTRREGVELTASAQLGSSLLHASYAFTRATFRTGGLELFSIREEAGGENAVEVGDRFPLVPSHTLRAGASMGLGGGLEIGTEGRWIGERPLRGDEANEEAPLDGHGVLDARLSYARAGWTARAVVRNVLDARYATYGTFNLNQSAGGALERFLTPGEPRAVRIVLERRFGGER